METFAAAVAALINLLAIALYHDQAGHGAQRHRRSFVRVHRRAALLG
jgi:hypothetical protein